MWEYFINQGFSREQTAGILGNLYQENKYSTDGDGLAQWLGNRLAGLRQRENYETLAVQLDYIVWELHNTEKQAYTQLVGQSTVEGATRAFQVYYERCNPNYCMDDQRILYAFEAYNRN